MSDLVLKSAPSVRSVVKSALAAAGAVFATIAAASAVAYAVETRRDPAVADLATLGMNGARFKKYY